MAVLSAEEKTQRNRDTAALLAKINEVTGTRNTAQTMQTEFFKKAGVNIGINSKTNAVTIDGKSVKDYQYRKEPLGAESSTNLRKTDMQKKKEDRAEEKWKVDSLHTKKAQAEKALADFDQKAEYDATSAHDRQRWNAEREQLQKAVDQAGAELKSHEETAHRQHDREIIRTMDQEDRKSLEQYAVNQVRDQNLPIELAGMMPTAEQESASFTNKFGKQRAKEMAETFMREENAKLAEQAEGAGRKFAEGLPGWASAATVPINLMSGIVGTMGQLQGAARATGRYRSLDANETGTALDKFSGAVRGQVAQDISGDVYDQNGNQVKDGGILRQLGSYAYQGGMSFIDSTARMLATGGSSGISSAIAGLGAFSQGLQKYSAMGASPERAALAATASAGLEYITEKLPTDEVLKIFHKGGGTNAVKEVLKQAFLTEPLGEEVNLFAGIAAEALILGEKSGKAQRIGDLIAGGMTKAEAEKQFWKETFAEAAETYAVSAVAGGLGAGGAAVAGNQVQQSQEQQQVRTEAPAAQMQQEGSDAALPQQEAQVPVLTEAEQAQMALDSAGAALAENAPVPATTAPMNDHQQNLQMAMEDLLGGQKQEVTQDPRVAEIQKTDAEREANKQRHQQVYEDLLAGKRRQKELQKQIDKAEQKLKETGRGSKARIDQLKSELEQQNNLVAQLESQNTYFTGDYERTLEEAVTQQEAVFENAREEARQAIADHEAGLITDSQLQAAQDKYNTAGQEVYRLKHMTQEQYVAELAEVGLIGERKNSKEEPTSEQHLQKAIQELSGNNRQNSVDSRTNSGYNNTRSEQVQNAIDRLNNGGDSTPTIDEIMSIPEIAEAERANKGPETINLPNREQIRENGYRQAMQKGSWDGKDYAGEVRQERRMDIVIGLPGSGKSSVYTERLSQEHKSRVIDTDDFREYIPEYNGSNASVVHEESSEIRDRVFDTALDNGDNILLSTIGANAEKLAKQIAAYKEDGYQVYLHLNELPNNKSLARAIGRYISEDGKLGRYVSPELIAGYGDKPTQTYLYLTGQGGNKNGELDGSIRASRGSASGDAAKAGGTAQGPAGAAVPADLLAGYDWYNNDVAKGEPPRLIQTSDDSNVNASAVSPQTGDNGNLPPVGGQETSVSNPDYRNSNTYMNTGLRSSNANIRAGYRQELRQDPTAARYEVKHNADTLAEAQRRTGSPENNAAALQDLLNRDHWTPEDVATSTLLLDQIMASGDKAAIHQLNALRQKRKEAGTYSGQVAQSFAIHNPTMKAADSPATAVDAFRSNLDGMKQEETTWNKKSGVDFENWKNQIKDDVDRIGIAIATVEDGDSDSMRQIIRQIAQRRGTTAWFGTSQNLTGNAWSVLKKLDFQDLKKVANTQLVAMADDYRARGAGEVAKGLRKQNMLSSLKTFVRNISGNVVGSFADSVSESGAGRMADAVLSKFTGKQTMGSDILRASDYAKAAREAGQFASLCVELNIPIETDVDSSYSAAAGNSGNNKYLGKTFRATGNPAMRALYAYQKYMSYALEVTDKIFEGGTNAAVAESLNRLQGANLTEEEVAALADFTGNRRTFKNATWEEDGKTKGSTLARKASGLQNELGIVGEVAMPFVSTPMNVTQTGIDYTAGVVKGLGEMVSIIKDAKAGKTIPVERQRQAASDFGRGVTGTAMIAMFASAAAMGALKVSNSEDWDKEALAQAEGRSGAQINWSALQRGLNGEDAKWQSGDIISGMDFLEPFNTQMYLGAELSQADDFNLLTGAGATIKSVWQSLMDSPVMTGLADIEQTLNDISEAESTEDAVNVAAGYAGDVASSYVPQFVRQTAQNQDGYYRDTRGENALDSAINSFMAAIPGQSEKLPVKYSGLGEAQKRGSAVETFLDPTATKVFQQNEVTTFLDELSNKVGEKANNIYPDRQAPMKFTYGNDWEVKLDGKMRETYQKTYGEKVNELYTSLIHDKDFQGFSDELKIKALEEAKSYATRYAKAAVSDYREAPIGTVQALAKGIVQREVKSQMDAFFTDLDTQREYGYSTEETAAMLEESYQAFTGLSKDTQKEILEQATSDTAKYLEVRQKGVSTEQFLTATETLDGLKPQTGYKAVRDIQKWEAISKQPGLSDSGKDALMLAYMQDYDPTDKSPVKTELKYEYARQELGLTPREYVEVYNVSTSGKKNQKIATWQDMGYSRAEANMFYRLFSATGKTKIDVVDWYNG